PVYHGENGVRTLRELGRSYLTVTKDLTRVMNRVKALYRSWAIPCPGEKVYSPRYRKAWLEKLSEAGVRRRAERLYQQLDGLRQIRREARRELLAESKKHPANQLLRQIPRLGPIRVALLIALIQTPHRFRTKRQLWAYSGLALQTRASSEYRVSGGQLHRAKRQPSLRGLNENHNHELKAVFKSTATRASTSAGAFGDFYAGLLATGMRPTMARLTVARKIAAIVLTIWKKAVPPLRRIEQAVTVGVPIAAVCCERTRLQLRPFLHWCVCPKESMAPGRRFNISEAVKAPPQARNHVPGNLGCRVLEGRGDSKQRPAQG